MRDCMVPSKHWILFINDDLIYEQPSSVAPPSLWFYDSDFLEKTGPNPEEYVEHKYGREVVGRVSKRGLPKKVTASNNIFGIGTVW